MTTAPLQPLVTAQLAPGTYSGATITVSNPQVVASGATTLLPVANGDTVRVRGLLLFARNTQAYTLVTSSIAHQ